METTGEDRDSIKGRAGLTGSSCGSLGLATFLQATCRFTSSPFPGGVFSTFLSAAFLDFLIAAILGGVGSPRLRRAPCRIAVAPNSRLNPSTARRQKDGEEGKCGPSGAYAQDRSVSLCIKVLNLRFPGRWSPSTPAVAVDGPAIVDEIAAWSAAA